MTDTEIIQEAWLAVGRYWDFDDQPFMRSNVNAEYVEFIKIEMWQGSVIKGKYRNTEVRLV